MISDLPLYVYLTFVGALLYSLVMLYFASNKNIKFLIGIILWGTVHSILALIGFYDNTMTTPPRVVLIVFPIFVILMSSIFSRKMKTFLGTFNLKTLTYLHAVRIPVELTLYWLFVANYVPELMTFEGRNFDIIAGITAIIVALVAFRNSKINKPILWVWNIFSIVLLVNILINAVLSMPTKMQMLAFEQPNIAVLKFPFLLLPTVIVPIVLISNLAGFIILNKKK